ncbi:hypothetical protein ACFQ0J_41090 [Planotetraspora mira]
MVGRTPEFSGKRRLTPAHCTPKSSAS